MVSFVRRLRTTCSRVRVRDFFGALLVDAEVGAVVDGAVTELDMVSLFLRSGRIVLAEASESLQG